MTFSIIARDPATGDLGGAVQSKFLAVGAAVLHARAGVGIVATQAHANVSFGPRGLTLLEQGLKPAQALEALLGADDRAARRQVGIVAADGASGAHTGGECMAWAGHHTADGIACQGNILRSEATVGAMVETLASRSQLAFPERLVAALAAGQAAGGDARGQQSAALLVVRPGGGYGGQTDRLVDLRVDDHIEPIAELERLLGLHRLYFERPSASDLRPITGPLEEELIWRLTEVGDLTGGADGASLWASLERWAGRENLEERMVRPGHIDAAVLEILRARTGSRAPSPRKEVDARK